MRIRRTDIEFEEHAPRSASQGDVVVEYPELRRATATASSHWMSRPAPSARRSARRRRAERYREVDVREDARRPARPDRGRDRLRLDIAYKPQYIEIDQPMRVDAFLSSITDQFGSSYWNTEIANPLQLNRIMERNLTDLSGGERQRVAIAACLSQDADLYLLDEPSAHLDVEQRVRRPPPSAATPRTTTRRRWSSTTTST